MSGRDEVPSKADCTSVLQLVLEKEGRCSLGISTEITVPFRCLKMTGRDLFRCPSLNIETLREGRKSY
jgi:hypothetical protein